MRVKKFISIALFIIAMLVFSGCKDKFSGSLNIPDKINICAEGKEKQIVKDGDKFDQALFHRINELVQIRIPKELSVLEGEFSDKDLKEANVYAVEFIYSKPQSIVINYVRKEKIEFKEIVFPLTERWQNTAFIRKIDNSYVPVGLRENLDYLVKASIK